MRVLASTTFAVCLTFFLGSCKKAPSVPSTPKATSSTASSAAASGETDIPVTLSAKYAASGQQRSTSCLFTYSGKITNCREFFIPTDCSQAISGSDSNLKVTEVKGCPQKDLYKACLQKDNNKLITADWYYKGNEEGAKESCETELVLP